ncbi:MAG: hypothetical protein IPN61_02075 [Bacteroidetes bacterium]|nr:hypothetical protein [Bacteroidota bacterium]
MYLSNGTAPYTYSGDDTTNLVTGSYFYNVIDAVGCTASFELKVFVTNCIIPYYEPPTNDTIDNLIGAELTQLYSYPDSLVDTTATNNIFLIDDNQGEVLIEVFQTSVSTIYLLLYANSCLWHEQH